ncbi:MAG TPA: aminotransferase class I/II-fold pyridoxal phosphate-dependent enzyme [Mycobacteriales bacterium]|nr:aminotransferase class I/II-fold pyridoxal phosphate-dependent enzyme [Mycobacteriales bacterium]
MPDPRGESTRAVHTPPLASFDQTPLALPVHRATTYAFDTAQAYADVLADTADGYCYARIDSPTADAFAAAVAALEGAGLDDEVVGQPFASGMAAITTVLMALTGAGRHVVAPLRVYGGTYGLLVHQLARFGVETSFVDTTDLDAVRAAVRPETALVYAETIANPTLTVADLPGLSAVAREAGVPFVVDSTFASPVVCRPLEHGADVVVHSATKYLGGHSDATGGVAVGAPELLTRVRRARVDLGGQLGPDEAFLLHRGLATLPLRVAQQCRTALAVAQALESHPAVQSVDHPGLAAHASNALARKLFDGGRYGGVVTVTPRGGREAGMALCDRLRLVAVATSLGGTHSVASHVASTTHRQLDDAGLAAAGIDPGAVRVSIGLEDADDLLADLTQALGAR